MPVLIDVEDKVIAGLGRLLACRELGRSETPTLCRRQAGARLPQHHDEPVVLRDLPDPAGGPAPGGAGVCHHPPGLSARYLEWLTGRGADLILIDDPLKPEEALSDTQR